MLRRDFQQDYKAKLKYSSLHMTLQNGIGIFYCIPRRETGCAQSAWLIGRVGVQEPRSQTLWVADPMSPRPRRSLVVTFGYCLATSRTSRPASPRDIPTHYATYRCLPIRPLPLPSYPLPFYPLRPDLLSRLLLFSGRQPVSTLRRRTGSR